MILNIASEIPKVYPDPTKSSAIKDVHEKLGPTIGRGVFIKKTVFRTEQITGAFVPDFSHETIE